MVYFKWNLHADAWKKYQANNLTSPSMLELGLGLGLGLSVVTNYLLFCMHLFCSIIWQQIMILWKGVSERRLYKKINVTGDFKVKLYKMMIMQFSEMWSYLTWRRVVWPDLTKFNWILWGETRKETNAWCNIKIAVLEKMSANYWFRQDATKQISKYSPHSHVKSVTWTVN